MLHSISTILCMLGFVTLGVSAMSVHRIPILLLSKCMAIRYWMDDADSACILIYRSLFKLWIKACGFANSHPIYFSLWQLPLVQQPSHPCPHPFPLWQSLYTLYAASPTIQTTTAPTIHVPIKHAPPAEISPSVCSYLSAF